MTKYLRMWYKPTRAYRILFSWDGFQFNILMQIWNLHNLKDYLTSHWKSRLISKDILPCYDLHHQGLKPCMDGSQTPNLLILKPRHFK